MGARGCGCRHVDVEVARTPGSNRGDGEGDGTEASVHPHCLVAAHVTPGRCPAVEQPPALVDRYTGRDLGAVRVGEVGHEDGAVRPVGPDRDLHPEGVSEGSVRALEDVGGPVEAGRGGHGDRRGEVSCLAWPDRGDVKGLGPEAPAHSHGFVAARIAPGRGSAVRETPALVNDLARRNRGAVGIVDIPREVGAVRRWARSPVLVVLDEECGVIVAVSRDAVRWVVVLSAAVVVRDTGVACADIDPRRNVGAAREGRVHEGLVVLDLEVEVGLEGDRVPEHADLLPQRHPLALLHVAVRLYVPVEAVDELAIDLVLDDNHVHVVAAVVQDGDHGSSRRRIDGLAQAAHAALEPVLAQVPPVPALARFRVPAVAEPVRHPPPARRVRISHRIGPGVCRRGRVLPGEVDHGVAAVVEVLDVDPVISRGEGSVHRVRGRPVQAPLPLVQDERVVDVEIDPVVVRNREPVVAGVEPGQSRPGRGEIV